MVSVLIADVFKSSLVMTSEVFKDRLQGAAVYIAGTGEQTLKIVEEQPMDMIVIDFDLPDVDGVTLTKLLRRTFSGPILITAYPDNIVSEVIPRELFTYSDASAWLAKPIKHQKLVEMIDHFLVKKRRFRRRYSTVIDALIVGKGAGRGKRAPKVRGKIVNMSIGGALLNLEHGLKFKTGEDISLTMFYPASSQDGSSLTLKSVPNNKTPRSLTIENSTAVSPITTQTDSQGWQKGIAKLKAKVAWVDQNGKLAGVNFENLSENHRRAVEAILRQSSEIN